MLVILHEEGGWIDLIKKKKGEIISILFASQFSCMVGHIPNWNAWDSNYPKRPRQVQIDLFALTLTGEAENT